VVAEVGYLLGRGRHAEREAQFLGSLADGTLTPVELTTADYRVELTSRLLDAGCRSVPGPVKSGRSAPSRPYHIDLHRQQTELVPRRMVRWLR
jgi:hypothetical protein